MNLLAYTSGPAKMRTTMYRPKLEAGPSKKHMTGTYSNSLAIWRLFLHTQTFKQLKQVICTRSNSIDPEPPNSKYPENEALQPCAFQLSSPPAFQPCAFQLSSPPACRLPALHPSCLPAFRPSSFQALQLQPSKLPARLEGGRAGVFKLGSPKAERLEG